MYEPISGYTLYLMFYAGVTVLNLIACCYMLFRRSNAIAPDVTSPLRLRRRTAAFLGACTLSHLWYMPLIYLTSAEDIMMLYLVCALLDFLLLTKDVLTCPVTEIHEAKPAATYFEGKKVFAKPNE